MTPESFLAIVNAVGIGALVVITWYYAKQTRDTNQATQKLVEETTMSRRMAVIPALTCQVEPTTLPPTENGEGNIAGCGIFNAVHIRNVGTGPVAEASMHVELANEEHSRLYIEKQDKPVWIVGTDAEGITIPLNEAELRSSTAEHKRDEQPTLDIELKYKNSYGIEFVTIATFQFVPNNMNNKFGVLTEMCRWSKVSERMPIQQT